MKERKIFKSNGMFAYPIYKVGERVMYKGQETTVISLFNDKGSNWYFVEDELGALSEEELKKI